MKFLTKIFLVGLLCTSSLFAFKPTIAPIEVNGVKVYLLPEDGVANEDGLIDQFWLAEKIENGTVPKNIHIVDIRQADEYKVSHIEGAINVPYDSTKEELDVSKFPEDGVIVFHCKTGVMSSDAINTLDDDILERVLVFDITYKCDDNNNNCSVNPNEAL